MPVLTALDALGIQSFVFASNRLVDVLGGAALVRDLTEHDPRAPGRLTALASQAGGAVIAAAGGNAVLRFPDTAAARAFAARYSRAVFDAAPGLEVAIHHLDYADGDLLNALQRVRRELDSAGDAHRPHAPLLGLGVTARCRETHGPAVDLSAPGITPDDAAVPASAAVIARRASTVRGSVDARWRGFLADRGLDTWTDDSGHTWPLTLPHDLEGLGRSRHDSSLIGVIHLDGNGIGARIASWARDFAASNPSEDVIAETYAQLSTDLNATGEDALAAMLTRVRDALRVRNGVVELASAATGAALPLQTSAAGIALPVLPIVLGGDSLTVVCDGRIALDLAAAALRAFSARQVPILADTIHASAGVALTRTGYPFARSYAAAEQITGEAKKLARAGDGTSTLAWALLTGADSGREVDQARVYRLDGETPDAWSWLEGAVLTAFRDGRWGRSHSRVKRLSELAPRGMDAVHAQVAEWRAADPELTLPPGVDAATLSDAVALLDIHLPLNPDVRS